MAGIELVFWYWWIVAVLLLCIELLAPGFFFLWMAVAAVVTGFMLLLIPGLIIEIQLLSFSILSVVSIVIWRSYIKTNPIETDHPLLNVRGARYIGRVFTLEKPIISGQGKINIDHTSWKIHGEDCDTGSKVQVVAVKGTVLEVVKED